MSILRGDRCGSIVLRASSGSSFLLRGDRCGSIVLGRVKETTEPSQPEYSAIGFLEAAIARADGQGAIEYPYVGSGNLFVAVSNPEAAGYFLGSYNASVSLRAPALALTGASARVYSGLGSLAARPPALVSVGAVAPVYGLAGGLLVPAGVVLGTGSIDAPPMYDGTGSLLAPVYELGGMGRAIIESIGSGQLIALVPNAFGVSAAAIEYAGTGLLLLRPPRLLGAGSKISEPRANLFATVGIIGSGSFIRLSPKPDEFTPVRYLCLITGSADSVDDIYVPMSGFQVSIPTGREPSGECWIPLTESASTALHNRPHGEVIIQFSQGSTLDQIIRYEAIQRRFDLGPTSATATLAGRGEEVIRDPRIWPFDTVQFVSIDGASVRYRLTASGGVLPGDSILYNGTLREVSAVTWTVTTRQMVLEVTVI